MLTAALFTRWIISIIVMCLLLIGFYIFLRLIKENKIQFKKDVTREKKNNMQICDQLYLDSKNKIIKVKDNDKIITLLLGSNVKFIKEEKIKNGSK